MELMELMPDMVLSAIKLEVLTQVVIEEQKVELLPARNCLTTTFSRAKNPLGVCDGFATAGSLLGAIAGGAGALASTQPELGLVTVPAGSAQGYAEGCAADAYFASRR